MLTVNFSVLFDQGVFFSIFTVHNYLLSQHIVDVVCEKNLKNPNIWDLETVI